jgi:hypothetical protein
MKALLNNKSKVTIFIILLSMVLLINPFVEWKSSDAINKLSKKALNQISQYDGLEANFLSNEIVIYDIVFSNGSNKENIGAINVKAKEVIMEMDFSMAIWKNFQVENVSLNKVDINLNYEAPGNSNIHEMQDFFQGYIENRNSSKKIPLTWNVDTIDMNDVSIKLTDYEYGKVGTLFIKRLSIPQINSSFGKEQNKQILMASLYTAVYTQWRSKTLKGEYDAALLKSFMIREGKAKVKKIFPTGIGGKLKQMLLNKMNKGG